MCAAFIHPVRSFLTTLLLMFLAVAAANAQEPEPGPDNIVTVIATRLIQGGNIAAAKQEAVEAALAAAVDQAAMIVFSTEVLAREFKPYSAVVSGNTEKFIDSYKILGESSSGRNYRIMLQATVSFDQLKASLAEFQPVAGSDPGLSAGLGAGPDPGSVEAVERPKLLILLSEQNINDISPKFWWGENAKPTAANAETAIARNAEEAGFVVIDHGSGTPDVPVKAAIIFQPELSNRDASDIGQRLGADVVIVGKAIVYAIGDTGAGGDPAYNATITVRAVRADNGQEISSGFETAVRQDSNEIEGSRKALTAAGTQAADHLIPSIRSVLKTIAPPAESNSPSAENITLTVIGTDNLGNFVRFRQGLRGTEGVKDLQVQQMVPNEAVIVVQFEGSAQELGERLINNTFQLFDIDIRNISNTDLDIALVPK